jgi:hypothetical protein
MMKHLSLCIYTLIILCFVSCNSSNPAKLWFYTHSLGDIDNTNSTLTPASFLYLQKDGSYTKDFGVFEYGHWTKKDDKLVLTNATNTTTTIEVKYAGAKDLQLVMDKNVIASFEAQPSSFTSNQVDPFTLVNNKWRLPATHKENEQEIRKRLRNHCQFWEAYFAWALDNKIDYIDVRSTPTPIKIYGNGFGLKPFNELPAAWRAYFFDAEDCKIANNLLYEVFQFHEISWAHTDNKYKMFLSAFQQLQQFLK